CAVVKDQCRLAAAPRPATPLSVVRGSRRHVAHVDDVQLGDIDSELHRRRAEKDWEPACPEVVLPLLALCRRNLCGVLARLEPLAVSGHALIEGDEEWVRAPTVFR